MYPIESESINVSLNIYFKDSTGNFFFFSRRRIKLGDKGFTQTGSLEFLVQVIMDPMFNKGFKPFPKK